MDIATIDIDNSTGEQTIHIPKEMRIDDDKVYLKKMGNTLCVIPYHTPWQSLIDSVDLFSSDFMESRHQPTQQERNYFDE